MWPQAGSASDAGAPDMQQELVTFQIRDRNTGELLREVPEGDAAGLFEQLQELNGALFDRSF